MQYQYKDKRYDTRYDNVIADLYAEGHTGYQIWIMLEKDIAKTTVYRKIKRIIERYNETLAHNSADFD
jgi:hypothetical protein